jgi:hypothetical protein
MRPNITAYHQARTVRICHGLTLDSPQPNFGFATIKLLGLQYNICDSFRLRGRSMVIHDGCVAAAVRIGFASGILCPIKGLSNFP